MKRIFSFLLAVVSVSAFSQSTGGKYSSKYAAIATGGATAPGKNLLDFKSQYYDTLHQLKRSFTSRSECYGYYTASNGTLPQITPGQKVWIDTCGSLNTTTGVLTPGCPVEYVFGIDLQLRLYLPVIVPGSGNTDLSGYYNKLDVDSVVTIDKATNQNQLAAVLSLARTKVVRLKLDGTSISSFANSAMQRAALEIQMEYGSAGTVYQFGILGGNFHNSNGFLKQNYGAPPYFRSVMTASTPDYVRSEFCRSINVVYSKESNGDSVNILVDGVVVGGINCQGSQSYENVFTYTASSYGYHTLTIKHPTTGRVYLERDEYLNGKNGILIENATMGGYALGDMYLATARPPGSGNSADEPTIPVVGDNGVIAAAGRQGITKPDIWFIEHMTNDAYSTFEQAFNKVAEITYQNNVPVLVVTEMPALSFITIDGQFSGRLPHYKLQKSLCRKYSNFFLCDWIELVKKDFANRAVYKLKYFPGVDDVHPNLDGQNKCYNEMRRILQFKQTGFENIYQIAGTKYDGTAGTLATANPKDVAIAPITNAVVDGETRPVVGKVSNLFSGEVTALMYSEKLVNYADFNLTNALIQSAPTGVDEFGPYIEMSNSTLGISFVEGIRKLNIVLLCRPIDTTNGYNTQRSINFLDYGSGDRPDFYSDSTLFPKDAAGKVNIDFYLNYRPVYKYLSLQRSGTAGISSFSGQVSGGSTRIYGIWATTATLPTIIPLATPRKIGSPFQIHAPLLSNQVAVGRTYYYNNGSEEAELVATGGEANMLPIGSMAGGTKYPVYRYMNKAMNTFIRLKSKNEGTWVLNPGGGETNNGTNNYEKQINPALEMVGSGKYTLFFELFQPLTTFMQLQLYDPGNSSVLFLQPNGTWGAGQTNLANPFSLNGNNAFQFNMPSPSQLSSFNNGTYLIFKINSTQSTNVTIARGEFPCL